MLYEVITLETLNLDGNQIGDQGALAIAQSPHLSNLKKLDLYNNQISPEGLKALLQSEHLKSLESYNFV